MLLFYQHFFAITAGPRISRIIKDKQTETNFFRLHCMCLLTFDKISGL